MTDRAALHALLDDALIAHLGIDVGNHPLVLPVAFAVDHSGPDRDGTLYVHGSVASRWLAASESTTVCVTITEVDGLVAARSSFHHSMNYRSAVIIGQARIVSDSDEVDRALALTVDHMIPGRSATLRPNTRKELAATSVLAIALHEASVKVRAGGPVDDDEDVEAGVWGGVVPVRRVVDEPVPDELNRQECAVPGDVRSRSRR